MTIVVCNADANRMPQTIADLKVECRWSPWWSFFWTCFPDLNLLLQYPTAQDCGGAIAHPVARRLSNVSGKNNARDWWRSFKDGPDSQIACAFDRFLVFTCFYIYRYHLVPFVRTCCCCCCCFFFALVYPNRWLFLILHVNQGLIPTLSLPLMVLCFWVAFLSSRSDFWTCVHLTRIRKCSKSVFLWSTKI